MSPDARSMREAAEITSSLAMAESDLDLADTGAAVGRIERQTDLESEPGRELQ